jgi:hypothetical protein
MDASRPIPAKIDDDQVQNRLPANILNKYLKILQLPWCDLMQSLERAHDGKMESTRPGGAGDILPMETATWSRDASSPVPEPQGPIHERQPNPSSQLRRAGQALVARRDPAAPSQPLSTLTSGLPWLTHGFLVSTHKLFFFPSHQMFGHMHKTLNVDKKTNYTVCMKTARQIY